jgi:hypothetical protein
VSRESQTNRGKRGDRIVLDGNFIDGEISSIWPIRHVGNRDPTPPDTRIFSPLAGAGLCVPIGRYMYLFKRLTAVSAGRFYRFEYIVTYSSGKVVAKPLNPVGPESSQPSH